MINPSQISPLINALKWLTWLVSLSLLLLSVIFLYHDRRIETVDLTEPQVIDYPIKTIKSVAILTPALQKGKALFTANCQQCHDIADNRVVGPGLLGVTQRVPNRTWLIKWIKNPSAVLSSGDVYANHMVKAFAPILMPGFPALKEEEIKVLIDYIDSYKSEWPGFVQ